MRVYDGGDLAVFLSVRQLCALAGDRPAADAGCRVAPRHPGNEFWVRTPLSVRHWMGFLQCPTGYTLRTSALAVLATTCMSESPPSTTASRQCGASTSTGFAKVQHVQAAMLHTLSALAAGCIFKQISGKGWQSWRTCTTTSVRGCRS